MESSIESGIQLLTRLSKKPSLAELDDVIFPDRLPSKATVEISGDVSCGKTFLLTQYLARCILPSQYQDLPVKGFNAHAVLINTDHHFQASKLAELMFAQIRNACTHNHAKSLADNVIHNVVYSFVDNLHVLNCYDSEQFLITLHTLEDMLLQNRSIALLAIDSILSYYWQDRESGGIQTMDLYIKNLLQIIQMQTFQSDVVTIYTRPTSGFRNASKEECVEKPTLGKINYKIELHRANQTVNYFSIISSAKGINQINYTINTEGLKWNTSVNEAKK